MVKKARAVLLCTAGILLAMLVFSMMMREKAIITVDTTTAKSQGIYNSILAKGTVEASESRSLVYSGAAVVKALYVKEGDIVSKNQTLLTLTPSSAALSLSEDELSTISNGVLDGSIATKDDLENALSVFLPTGQEQPQSKTIIVKSPIAGTVMKAPEGVGSQIFPGLSYMKISDLTKLSVRAKIPEMYIGQIKERQAANITGDALEGKTYSGVVKSIMPYASKTISLTGQGNQSYVESILTFEGGRNIRPGYTVDVKIFTDKQEDAVLVPYEAVTQIGNKEFVFVVKNGRAYQREVATGYELENQIQIQSGVERNDDVVLNPPDSLKNGNKIKRVEVEK